MPPSIPVINQVTAPHGVKSLQMGTMPSEPAFLSFSVSCFVINFIGDKLMESALIVKKKNRFS
jgi:hypothetical protein